MILLLDIGNAYIKVGKAEFLNNKYFLKDISYIETSLVTQNFETSSFFVDLILENNYDFIIFSSVVSKITKKLVALNNSKIMFFKDLLEATKTRILANKLIDISEVGSDILAMCYYFSETDVFSNKLIFSLGTANVAIFIKNNVFDGCLFALGLEPASKEILNYCSLLTSEKLRFDRFSFLVKQDTKTAIENGSLYQTAGFCELIANSYEYQKPICYLTGGNAKHVKFLLSKKYIKIGNLVLKGLLNFLNKNLNYFVKK
ncbi:type III pantothenate kinase [symbiont of Argiope bruennichi]|uniref:type III pantothenate kinase n=1 Tax=symbiont of Argiope bruennichi TaxID=2810479 RepID=UPI003DA3E155